MSWISNIFNFLLVDPLFSFLIFIYEQAFVESLGLAIILLTISIRVILFPLFYKGAKHQTLIQRLQPEVNKIRKKHKKDKEKQAYALMDLYSKNNINPFSGFFMLFVQIAVFFSLFWVFRSGERIEVFSNPYLFDIYLIEPSLILAVIVSIFQFFQSKLAFSQKKNMPSTGMMASFGKYMIYAGPIISLVVLTRFPAALAVYWGVNTLFSIGQQYIINKKIDKDDTNQDEPNKEKDIDTKIEKSKKFEDKDKKKKNNNNLK